MTDESQEYDNIHQNDEGAKIIKNPYSEVKRQLRTTITEIGENVENLEKYENVTLTQKTQSSAADDAQN